MGDSLEVGKWMAWLTSTASAPSPVSLSISLVGYWVRMRRAFSWSCLV
jgi:hypothetical protein